MFGCWLFIGRRRLFRRVLIGRRLLSRLFVCRCLSGRRSVIRRFVLGNFRHVLFVVSLSRFFESFHDFARIYLIVQKCWASICFMVATQHLLNHALEIFIAIFRRWQEADRLQRHRGVVVEPDATFERSAAAEKCLRRKKFPGSDLEPGSRSSLV